MSSNYSNISLPKGLTNEITNIIANRPDLGYKSVAEFTKDAIRKQIAEITKIEVVESVS